VEIEVRIRPQHTNAMIAWCLLGAAASAFPSTLSSALVVITCVASGVGLCIAFGAMLQLSFLSARYGDDMEYWRQLGRAVLWAVTPWFFFLSYWIVSWLVW
jgi:hypothetical protein